MTPRAPTRSSSKWSISSVPIRPRRFESPSPDVGDPYAIPDTRSPSAIPLVEVLRREVGAWRAGGRYDGARRTSKRLLEHWFLDEHQTSDGDPFAFYFCQREAIETVIYLHEVVGVRSASTLFGRYQVAPLSAPLDLPYAR